MRLLSNRLQAFISRMIADLRVNFDMMLLSLSAVAFTLLNARHLGVSCWANYHYGPREDRQATVARICLVNYVDACTYYTQQAAGYGRFEVRWTE